ncbi:MAG TPA: PrsW family glutamic-type intramembrane protease [Bacteroidales bacterium]|jgi:RsiW-degrading membrane proteinase PrsW (M82 family)|nr:PrsW family glutamic-type intramembrane protease [Bacteroidales bacterium]HOS71095.1 PrsW family glutamic-type intramembrane protease [Bacteroidales bacterium]HQH25637.1 PrsW family glutamic-type intramembrane protease [Bacteroidales bacterium]HQJ83225.1 PrsW family glutamic-type intramembrane protease [Bacteroidales bacterium]
MFNNLLFISLAPVFIIAWYIYSRDTYEKEPLRMLIKALYIGALCVIPVAIIEDVLMSLYQGSDEIRKAAYTAFLVAGFTEEVFKYSAFLLYIWKDRNFNEKFDGIVYAVYISLGFAGIENLMYVFRGGYGVGLMRALTAVPAHALFGIMMGYYFGLAKFSKRFRAAGIAAAFIVPFAFHGLYDFLLMSNTPLLLTAFLPVLVFYWISGFRKISKHLHASAFRPD